MTRLTTTETLTRLQWLAERAGLYPGPTEQQLTRLAVAMRSTAHLLHESGVRRCNGIPRFNRATGQVQPAWDESDESAADEYEAGRIEVIRALFFAAFGPFYQLRHQTDPRGAPIEIYERGANVASATPLQSFY